MDAEKVRAIVRKLPHVEETLQWGDNLVFWVGDKAIGGRMFALLNLDADDRGVLSFSAGQEGFALLLETEGVIPAPYMARIYWVALERWDVFSSRELAGLLAKAHALTYSKLPKRTKGLLGLPAAEQRRWIVERTQALAAAKAAKVAGNKADPPERAPR